MKKDDEIIIIVSIDTCTGGRGWRKIKGRNIVFIKEVFVNKVDGNKVPKHPVVAVAWRKPSRAMRHNNYRPSVVANFMEWKFARLT